MSRRYYSSEPISTSEPNSKSEVVLGDNQAHHLIHVMRAQVGDEVLLFDGGGVEFTAVIVAVDRRTVRLEIGERRDIDREARCKVTLGVALPKGDRQRFLCEKLVELGVARLVPLITARGVAQPSESSLRRLEKSVIEASKQCGRNRLMTVAPPQKLAEFFDSAPESSGRFVAHPSGVGEVFQATSAEQAFAAIGPEGGFTEDEVTAALAARWQVASLGARILRIETAALVVAVKLIGE